MAVVRDVKFTTRCSLLPCKHALSGGALTIGAAFGFSRGCYPSRTPPLVWAPWWWPWGFYLTHTETRLMLPLPWWGVGQVAAITKKSKIGQRNGTVGFLGPLPIFWTDPPGTGHDPQG